MVTNKQQGMREIMEIVFDQVIKRIEVEPTNKIQTRLLYEIFLGAIINNADLVITLLESAGKLEEIFGLLLEYSGKKIDCKEERKLFCIAFSILLKKDNLPVVIRG